TAMPSPRRDAAAGTYVPPFARKGPSGPNGSPGADPVRETAAMTPPKAKTAAPRVSRHTPVAHLTVAERSARGKAARPDVPRTSHAGFEPLPERRDPLEILQAQAATRVPDLVPLRYGRMVSSPFAFYRGAAAIMAADLATTPDSGLRSQLCGDAH